jgi:hypothetical protein
VIPTHPYQEEAAQAIAEHGAKLLADQPGLGKTHTALRAMTLRGLLAPSVHTVSLITAPLMVCDTAWVPKFRAYFPEVAIVDAYSGSRHARNRRLEQALVDQRGPIVIIANHDAIGISKRGEPHLPALHTLRLYAILIDESQYVLPATTDYPMESTEFWRGLFALNDHASRTALRIAMSGTPDRGKPWYRFGTWRFLRPQAMRTVRYQEWLRRNFHVWTLEVPVKGKSFKAKVQKVGLMKDPASWEALDRLLVIRRTKAEVASQLPDKLYVDVDVPFAGKQASDYHAYVAAFAEETDDGSLMHAATAALRAQQWADATWAEDENGELLPVIGGASSKLDWLLEWLERRGHVPGELHDPNGGKVVIASQFTRVLRWLMMELHSRGIRALIISGEQTARMRTDIQQEFQRDDDELRIVLLSAKIGVGIDLDAADDLIFFDLPRDPDEQEQVEDRIHRVSRVHQVMIWRLRARGTIDMVIAAKNDTVYQRTRAMLDGTRGVKYARTLLARLS